MVNYENGKIYKIINTENNDIVYIGSTTQSLSQRYQRHNNKATNHKIILIENYPCNSKEELCMKEQQIIEQHTNLLNQRKAYCSEEQKKEYLKSYREENKEQIKQIDKKYHEENKEHYKEYAKKYREENKEKVKKKKQCEFCNCSIRKSDMKRHQRSKKCLSFQNVED
jgi:hypothetical protein